MNNYNFSFEGFVTIPAKDETEARELLEHIIFNVPYYIEINNVRLEE